MPTPTSVRLPPNPKVEVEFTAGVWTDVTADLYPDVIAPNTTFGRSNEFAPPTPAEFSVALLNTSQNYTPQNTSSIYYPNVQRRKRIRYSYNPGSQRFRFLGYIKSWQPTLYDPDGGGGKYLPVMQIYAKCRLDQLSRVTMQSPLMTEYLADAPVAFWPLTESDNGTATQALDVSGQAQSPMLVRIPTQETLSFGDAGPGFGDGSGVRFAPGSATSGQVLDANPVNLSVAAFTLEVWCNPGRALPAWVTGSAVEAVARLARRVDNAFEAVLRVGSTGRPSVKLGATTKTGPASIVDGGWHHLAITRTTSGGNVTFYVDGASVGATAGSPAITNPDYLALGTDGGNINRYQGNVGYVAVYQSALSAGRIAAHFQAGRGYFGDTTDQRIARYLATAGLSTSDWNLDVGQAVVNTYPQAGTDVVTACQDMATTEGGGAVVYVDPTGTARFVNRRYRDNRTPKITLIAAGDLDPDIYQPSVDDTGLVTRVTVNRASQSGTQTTQVYDSGATDVFAAPVTTYTISDLDAYELAQYMVNSYASQALRFPQISIYLDQADHDLYDAVGQLGIGDRIRVTFPAVAYPVTTVDFFLEGWQEQPDPANGRYSGMWDVSQWDTADAFAL